jgi:hypothetical protein
VVTHNPSLAERFPIRYRMANHMLAGA